VLTNFKENICVASSLVKSSMHLC